MKTTPLHAAHVSLHAKMGEFAGYDMPLYYPLGVLKEHEWVRANAGLFDVSHMGQAIVAGAGATAFLERITPSAFAALPDFCAKYTVMTNEQGGIVDDLIVTRLGADRFFAVINAGCKDKDILWMAQHCPDDVTVSALPDRALLALQGPKAEAVLGAVLGIDGRTLAYMTMMVVGDLYVSRLGYTGEDGFEISVPQDQAVAVWDALCAHADVRPIGLAARDSLRLEMGYCLYGHDIDAVTTPLEAGLAWVMRKDRLDYIGADHVGPPLRRRVGIVVSDKGIAREGAEIVTLSGEVIGALTSGGYAPSLKQSVGQAYLPISYAAEGTEVGIRVRGQTLAARVQKMPFLTPKTKRKE